MAAEADGVVGLVVAAGVGVVDLTAAAGVAGFAVAAAGVEDFTISAGVVDLTATAAGVGGLATAAGVVGFAVAAAGVVDFAIAAGVAGLTTAAAAAGVAGLAIAAGVDNFAVVAAGVGGLTADVDGRVAGAASDGRGFLADTAALPNTASASRLKPPMSFSAGARSTAACDACCAFRTLYPVGSSYSIPAAAILAAPFCSRRTRRRRALLATFAVVGAACCARVMSFQGIFLKGRSAPTKVRGCTASAGRCCATRTRPSSG